MAKSKCPERQVTRDTRDRRPAGSFLCLCLPSVCERNSVDTTVMQLVRVDVFCTERYL